MGTGDGQFGANPQNRRCLQGRGWIALFRETMWKGKSRGPGKTRERSLREERIWGSA